MNKEIDKQGKPSFVAPSELSARLKTRFCSRTWSRLLVPKLECRENQPATFTIERRTLSALNAERVKN
jgi:hypothetical protein